MKGNFTFVSVLMGLVLGVSLAACKGESEKKQVRSDPVPVAVGKVRQIREQETITVSGSVNAPNSPANVSFLVSGKVVFSGPREGEYVRQGQVLARIDPTDYQLALAAAKAQTDKTEVVYKRAEDEHRRMKMLYDSKSLAPNDYLKFKAAFDSAAQQYEQDVASEKLTRKRLTDATLYAPASGYIAKRYIERSARASSQPRIVSKGMASSSGLNQELACCWRAKRICTCCRRALMSLSR